MGHPAPVFVLAVTIASVVVEEGKRSRFARQPTLLDETEKDGPPGFVPA
jgi:hypothetical protein